jgi:ABC-type uncharacterized transport system substrate-binding protein
LLGGAAATWPVAAHGQQAAMPVVGLLLVRARETTPPLVAAFRQGLREAGFVEGQNVEIEYRYGEGQRERLPVLAADSVVQRRVAVIATGPGGAERAAKSATATIPIVAVIGGDPLRMGLIASLSRPGGNLTGTTMFADVLEAKRLGLLHELVPQAGSIAVLFDANIPRDGLQAEAVLAAGRSIGVPIQIIRTGSERDFDDAFDTVARIGAGGLMVTGSAYFNDLSHRLTALAARHRIPAIYENREFADAGGLMTYAPSVFDAYRQIGVYAGRVLKGESPADLPVTQPTRFQFVINLKAAKLLGIEFPAKLLALADEVIE